MEGSDEQSCTCKNWMTSSPYHTPHESHAECLHFSMVEKESHKSQGQKINSHQACSNFEDPALDPLRIHQSPSHRPNPYDFTFSALGQHSPSSPIGKLASRQGKSPRPPQWTEVLSHESTHVRKRERVIGDKTDPIPQASLIPAVTQAG